MRDRETQPDLEIARLRFQNASLESLVNSANDGILILAADGQALFANAKFAEIVGYSESELIRTTLQDLAHPDEYPALAVRLRRRLAGESVPSRYETAIRSKDGSKIPIELTASKIIWLGQTADLVFVRDITERKQAEELLAIRLRLMEHSANHSVPELLQKALDEAGELVTSPIGFYHFIDADQTALVLQAWSTRTEKEFCIAQGKGAHYDLDRAGVWADAVCQRQPVIHNDYAALPYRKGLPEGHAAVHREVVVPVVRNDRVVAILGMGNKTAEYTAQDVKLLSTVADVTWEITVRKRIEQELHEQRDHLEQLVQSRTAELVAVNERLASEILERERAQAALRESEERHRRLVENANDIIYTIDPAGNFTSANRAAERILGYSREEVLALNIAQVVPPADLALARQILQDKVAKGEPSTTYPLHIYAKDGHLVSLELSTRLIYQDGQFSGSEGVARDVTERQEMEKVLRESETKFRIVAENTLDWENWTDPQDRLLYVSPACQRITGYPVSALMADRSLTRNLIHPADRARYAAHRTMVQKERRGGEIEFRIIRADGATRWISHHCQLVYDIDGTYLGNRGNNRDITERKQAETKIAQLAAIVESAEDIIISQTLDGRITSWNRGAANIYGYAEDEMLGQPVAILAPADQPDEIPGILEKIKAGSPAEHLETVRLKKDGQKFYVSLTLSPIHAEGLIVGASTIGHDITRRKHAEIELRESEEKYRSLLESQEGNIFVLDYDGVHHYVNQSGVASAVGARTPQDVLGRRLHDLFPAATADWQLEQIRRVIRTGEGISGEYEHVVDNQSYWWRLNIQPIHNAIGQVELAMVNSLNITDRKRAEQALRESEERFHTLADTAPVLIWMAGPETLCNFVNQPWLAFTGRRMEQELGTGWTENVHPDDLPRCLEVYLHAFNARQPFSLEYRLRRADGEFRWVVNNGVPRLLPDGTLVGYIGSCIDITERRRTEEQLRFSSAHDALTGIYNRAFFETELARLGRRPEYPVSLCIADLDNMKLTNDTLGHAAGDELLKRTAQVLLSVFRASDILARIGGDEFALLLPNTDEATAAAIVSRIRENLEKSKTEFPDLPLNLSLGMATATEGDLMATYKLADERMYADKRSHKSEARDP